MGHSSATPPRCPPARGGRRALARLSGPADGHELRSRPARPLRPAASSRCRRPHADGHPPGARAAPGGGAEPAVRGGGGPRRGRRVRAVAGGLTLMGILLVLAPLLEWGLSLLFVAVSSLVRGRREHQE